MTRLPSVTTRSSTLHFNKKHLIVYKLAGPSPNDEGQGAKHSPLEIEFDFDCEFDFEFGSDFDDGVGVDSGFDFRFGFDIGFDVGFGFD